jgi:para-nitrobenzyl esterase
MSRRLALIAALAGLMAPPVQAQLRRIDNGVVEGVTAPSGVEMWKGIPFAAPPVRALRWKAPQPVTPWQGSYHADRPAPMCLQPLRARTMNHYFGNEATSEDCLYLNVWAPPEAAGKALPVIVWIYGGAFNVGSANMANYDGEALAAKGVVRVNLAYRVGPLGFLSHPDLTKEGGGTSGNYGLMDQIAGLEWVRRNIAAFGGDPGNVTIVGQSAGSMSVALLQQSPRAKGLFHKVVGMSGSPFGELLRPVPLAEAEAQGDALQKALNTDGIEAMRDLPADRVLSAAQGIPREPIVIDGQVLTGAAQDVFARRAQSDVPVMIGYTRDENFMSLGPVKTIVEWQAAIRKAFPQTAEVVLKAYPVKSEADVSRAVADVQRDATLGRQMFGWARAQAANGKAPAYAWFFTRRQPYADGIRFADHEPATAGAYHTGDVPYWFRTLDSLNLFRITRNWEAGDRALEDRMSAMLLSFARTGKPAPDWPAFDPKRPQVMRLGFDAGVIDWPNFKALDALATQPVSRPATGSRPRD